MKLFHKPRLLSLKKFHLTCISFVVVVLVLESVLVISRLSYNYIIGTWYDKDLGNLELYENSSDREIVILRWTKYWEQYISPSPLIFRDGDTCAQLQEPYTTNCRVTYDRRYAERSDVIVFHIWDVSMRDLPPRYRKDQIWVLQNHETPVYNTSKISWNQYAHLFNWSMTYRRDSDLYDPYGLILPISPSEQNARLSQLAAKPTQIHNKTKLIAWIVSKCETDSNREFLVRELQKHVQIDIFGKCGEHTCPEEDCRYFVAQSYKFYLAFENSVCEDYATEKFFSSVMYDIVPVVYGGANYSTIAPEKSYINVKDFESVKDLADFLKYLDGNDDEYVKYFEWKRKYDVLIGRGDESWCKHCQKVRQMLEQRDKGEVRQNWYSDLNQWWNYYVKSDDGENRKIENACSLPTFKIS